MSEVRWEDRHRMPKGHKIAPREQGGLFVMAAEPRPVKAPVLPAELPGQLSILDAE